MEEILYPIYFFSVQELRKRLKILSNDYAPIAEKRLVMRTTFGNFRQRMIKEDLQNRLSKFLFLLIPTVFTAQFT